MFWKVTTILISFCFLFFFFSDSILFNEEFLICFSLILIFYIIYKMLHKSIVFFFILDVEHLYLSLMYFLKLNISLANKLVDFLNIFINLLSYINMVKTSDLKYVYTKLLYKKSLKFEHCLFLLDKTLASRKNFWVMEGMKLLIKKNFLPIKIYNFLKLNNVSRKLKNNQNVYEKFFFTVQFFQAFYFIQFTNTLNKFIKLYKKIC